MWLLCVSHMVAIWLLSGCYVFVMWFICYFNAFLKIIIYVVAIWLLCGKYMVAMRFLCSFVSLSMWLLYGGYVVATRCYAVAMRLLCSCYAGASLESERIQMNKF